MLNDSKVTANVPVSDLGRARRFYADTLGLTPTGENPGGLVYTTGGGTSFLLPALLGSAGASVAGASFTSEPPLQAERAAMRTANRQK